MKVIWKYPLVVADVQTLLLPEDAQPLAVQEQHGDLCLWAHVDPTKPLVDQQIRMYGTGHLIPDGLDQEEYHIGTVQHYELVWHVFWVVDD